MDITFNEIIPLYRISAFSFFLYFVDWVLVFCLFAFNYRRHGVFSFSVLWTLFSFCLGILIPFFFAFSYLNIKSSTAIYQYSELTNYTFVISSIGFYAFIVGVVLGEKIKFVPLGLGPLIDSLHAIMTKKVFFNFFLVTIVLGVLVLLVLNVPFGQSRAFAMSNKNIRPIINFFTSVYAFFFILCFISSIYMRQTRYYVLTFLLFLINMWSGTRSGLLMPILYGLIIVAITNRSKNFLKYLFYGLFFIFCAFAVSQMRSDNEVDYSILFADVMFGNTFSDLRDFTWVYYYWDNRFLYGKTFLAGIMSFIPSYISDYRMEWSWGRWSTIAVYLDPEVHPGLRPGPFGEMYFNFGLFGVVVLGLVFGLLLARIDKILFLIRQNSRIDKKQLLFYVSSFFIYFSLVSALTVSAGYFAIYIKIFILFIGFLCAKIKFI